MLILLVLFSFLANASEEISEKFCFSSLTEAQLALNKLNTIKVPTDVITADDRCLVIQLSSHRRELVQRFILSSFPQAQVTSSFLEIRREPCKLKIEVIKKKTRLKNNVKINTTVIFENHSNSKQTSETALVQTLDVFEIALDEKRIEGKCNYINAERYDISLKLKHVPKIVMTPGGTRPPDQQTISLTSHIQLSRGERIELGSLFKSAKDQAQSVELTPNMEHHSQSLTFSEDVFLSLQ